MYDYTTTYNPVMIPRYISELPAYRQKSFYGKAHIITDIDGTIYLRSYETFVAAFHDNKIFRLWSGHSNTTARHIKAFYAYCLQSPELYKEFYKMPCYSVSHTSNLLKTIFTEEY